MAVVGMNRVEFTRNICLLMDEMFIEGERPILDYVKRSDAEQMRLYLQGKSKCDGIEKISQHQRGKAADIYFVSEDHSHIVDPTKGYGYWHDRWCELGGKEMILWDQGHFE